jgi:beta-glucanase (GH16 family)
MKNLSLSFIFMVTAFFSSCDKGDSAGTGNTPPANLTVTATVSTDNSGNVSFTASASNASSYEYDFGNGIFQTIPSGIVTYLYPASGTYTVNVIAKSAGGQTISKSIQITVAKSLSLVWSDEFDTPGLPNSSKWGYDIGTGSGGWGNNELQYYTNRLFNAEVANGALKITATKENFSGSAYTSARLLSKDKFAFKYGKVEVKAKLPAGGGTWPAIWMLGSDINTVSWPACGEIDIMEHLGNDLNKIYGTLHYPGRSGGNANGNTKIIANATTQFHIYSLEWTPLVIKIYVDDQLFHTVANSSSIPFNHDFFFIVNVAMGGNFGGLVDPAFTTASMEIDYIRVYQ